MKDLRAVISTVFLIVLSIVIVVIFYLNIPENWQSQNLIIRSVADLMLFYLLFILFRTIFILTLSFVEFFFQRTMDEVKTFPLVTIIVPAYNEGKVIENAIKSILDIDYPNLEVLVIDDGSKDDTFEVAKKMETDPRVRVIYKTNSGKSNTLNYGIEQANGEYFVCVDADSVLSKNVLLDSIPFFERDPHMAAVAGAVRVGNSTNLLTAFQRLEYIIGLNFHKKAQSALNMVTIVPGPIGIFKKEVVQKIGGYNTDTYAEDCDLTMRLLMSGYNIKYTGKITARTEAPDNISDLITQRYRWSRGMVQSIFKSVKYLREDFSLRGFIVVLYMLAETVCIPLINFAFVIITLEFALLYETTELMGPFFFGLILMDLTLCLYSVITENKKVKLIFLSILNRLTYGLGLEVIRFLSILDEIFRIPMKWGTLVRKGM